MIVQPLFGSPSCTVKWHGTFPILIIDATLKKFKSRGVNTPPSSCVCLHPTYPLIGVYTLWLKVSPLLKRVQLGRGVRYFSIILLYYYGFPINVSLSLSLSLFPGLRISYNLHTKDIHAFFEGINWGVLNFSGGYVIFFNLRG